MAAAGNSKRAGGSVASAAFLACLSSDDASVVVSLVGAGVGGLSIRESRVDAAAGGGDGGTPAAAPPASSTFPLPAPLPAPAVALASASEGRAVVLCSDGTLLAFDLADGAASLAWRHRLAAFSAAAPSSSAAAAAPTTPGSKKRGKAGSGNGSGGSPPAAPALVVPDAGRSVVAVFQASSTSSNVVVRAVAVDAALGAPRGVALVELPSSPPSSSSAAAAAATISASPLSRDSSALVVSLNGTAFVVAEEAFVAPAGVVGAGGHAGRDLASLVGALASTGSGRGGGSRLIAAAAAAAGVAAFDDGSGEEEEAARDYSSASLPLLVQPAWATALGKLSTAETGAATAAPAAAVAVPIPSLAAAAAAASASSRPSPSAAAPPPAHFVAAAEALKKMEAALLAASQSKTKASAAAAAAAAAARSWAEAAAASSSTPDDDSASPSSSHLPPLPSDLHGRAASAAARLGHWDSVKAALSALPLTHGGSCAGLMPAAAAAGEFEVLAAVASSAPDAPPADVAAVISLALSSAPSHKGLSAARRAWRDTLTAAAEEAVSAAEEAAAFSRGNPGMGPLASALAAEAAAAVAAVSSFEGGAGGEGSSDGGGGGGELALHALLAAPRDDAALQAALRAVPAGVAPALARYLAAWATALAPLPAVPARHYPRRQQQQQRGNGKSHSSRHQQHFRHPCGRLPTLCDVAAWASALVDAHLVALASSAAAAGAGAGAGGAEDDAEGTRRSLEALRAVAAERAADAASLAPLFGAAGHVLCGSPLPSVAVAAAAAYSVEMLDLGVRR